jgi:pilus assembly protein CpaC
MSPTPVRAMALAASLTLLTFTAQAAVTAKAKPASRSQTLSSTPCTTTQTVPLINVPLGKSVVLKLQAPASRIIMGNPEGGRAARPTLVEEVDKSALGNQGAPTSSSGGVADVDVVLLNPNEIYLLGKSVGSTNIIVVSRTGVCTIMDIAVGVDTKTLESRLDQFIPGSAIKITAAADSIILSGQVADATQVDRAMSIASAYSGQGTGKVINMISVADPQQVMLEVKVAEVSKTLVDKLGAKFNLPKINGSWTYSIVSDFLNGSPAGLSATNGSKLIELDAEKKDGLVKILAEPTIMAISGQEGSFLAGGIILIPTDSKYDPETGRVTSELDEKEFGVSLKFTPTVLANGRINLKVRPEVSELSAEGVTISEAGSANRSILPLINIRKAETTVQLNDGQSFAIGGLVKNNVVQNIKAFPILGEIPFIGALFRSSDFQSDKSELVFIVTPRLVKPLPPNYPLPTDSFVPPSRSEFFLEGKMEGMSPAEAQNPPATPGDTPPAASGFELK